MYAPATLNMVRLAKVCGAFAGLAVVLELAFRLAGLVVGGHAAGPVDGSKVGC